MKTLATLALLGLAYTFEDNEFIVRPIHVKPRKPLEKTVVEAHDHENFIRPPTRSSPFPDPRIPSPTFPHPKIPVYYEDEELFLPKASLLATNVPRSERVIAFEDEELFQTLPFRKPLLFPDPRIPSPTFPHPEHPIYYEDEELFLPKASLLATNVPRSERVIAFEDEELFQALPFKNPLPFPDPRIPSPTFPHPKVPVFYDDDELSLLKTTALASNLPRSERVIAFDGEELFQTLPFRKPLIFPDPRIPSPTFPRPETQILFDEELFMPGRVKTESLISDSMRAKNHLTKDDIEDENLVSLKNLINDGLHLYKDIKEKNLENAIKDGVQTVKDLKKKDKFLGH